MMKRLIPVFILIILISSCKKSSSDFIWEKTYGPGEALFIKPSPDSGFYACGETDGHPYFIRFFKDRSLCIDIKSDYPGLFSSAWFDTTGYITGGNTDGNMLLMRYDSDGAVLWEKSVDGGFNIDYTDISYTGDGTFLAVGTASPDSSASGSTGLFVVRFDTAGSVLSENSIETAAFVSAADAFVDNSGNIYLALTRKNSGSVTKASVAKYNDLLQKLWETELYNNPDFGAASLAIKTDLTGNIFVAGRTELSTADGNLDNSFVGSLTNTGIIRWKRYLENSNSGTDLVFDEDENLLMLNKNCFVVNVVYPENGDDAGVRIRMFEVCDPYNTDAYGTDIDINFDKNILVAGSRGGSFYLALKSSE